MSHQGFRSISVLLAFFAALPAEAQPSGGKTGSQSQELTAGTVVNARELERLGLIHVITSHPGQNGVSCSGILLANDWAMTAGHCLDVLEGKTTWVAPDFGVDRSQITADAIYKFGGGAFAPEGPDIGLIHLTRPIQVNGATAGFVTRFWNGKVEKGTKVAVYGRSKGYYQTANMDVEHIHWGRNLVMKKGGDGETTEDGDSGGPGIIWNQGTAHLVGIVSTGGQALLGSIPAHEKWILAVLKSQWFPARPTNSMKVYLDEINATQWSFAPYGNDLRSVPWSQAMRAASTLCVNRAMAGGYFEGLQNGTKFTLQCSNRKRVVWRDVPRSEFPAGSQFSDINATTWAQANRTAERLCFVGPRPPGSLSRRRPSAGGHFSGHQLGPVNGLFCYTTNSQWFDSTPENRAAAGAVIGDLNTVPWIDAAVAATRFCRAQGAQSGFFNGYQVAGKMGVVCLKN